jgi:hypothetical protein
LNNTFDSTHLVNIFYFTGDFLDIIDRYGNIVKKLRQVYGCRTLFPQVEAKGTSIVEFGIHSTDYCRKATKGSDVLRQRLT